MHEVAVIGLGRMGTGLAGRLLAAAYGVRVHTRTPGGAAEAALVAAGARSAGTAAQAVRGADVVVVMVSDDEASRQVWLGPDGVLAGTEPTAGGPAAGGPMAGGPMAGGPTAGALAIECSTLSYAWVAELAAAVRGRGLRYVDCPVTGLPDAAAAGTLTLLVGAEPDDLARARPVLDVLGSHLIHFGPVGAGTAYKLIVNLMGAVQIAGVAEGLAMAERAGLDLRQVAQALATGQAASPQVVRNGWRMVEGDHAREVVFPGRLRHKDADYGVRLADALGLRAPLGRAALSGLDQLLAEGLGDLNESGIIEVARRR